MQKSRLSFVLFWLATLLLFPSTGRAQTKLYSSFGSGMSFNNDGWEPIGSSGYTNVAAAFSPSGATKKFKLHRIDLGIGDFTGATPFAVTVALAKDASGQPGTIVESWNNVIANGATQIATVYDTLGIQLNNGQQYWVIVTGCPATEGFCEDTWWASPSTSGAVDYNNGSGWSAVPGEMGAATTGVTQAFDVFGYEVTPKGPVHWLGFNQILQFVVAGPITPAPGTPVEAIVSFVDLNGDAIGPPPVPLTINPGQFVSVDFAANQYIKTVGPRIAVRPVLTILPNPNAVAGTPPVDVQTAVEVIDAIVGFGTLFGPGPLWPPDPCFPPDPCNVGPSLVPQGLAGGQALRITAVAFPPDPCAATLGFADQNGNPLGGSIPVSLQPGTGAFFDLNASALGLAPGQRTEVLPVVTPTPPISATAITPMASACQVSVEAFDRATGRTQTYQGGMMKSVPAVQSPPTSSSPN